jgi:hypothetical protein
MAKCNLMCSIVVASSGMDFGVFFSLFFPPFVSPTHLVYALTVSMLDVGNRFFLCDSGQEKQVHFVGCLRHKFSHLRSYLVAGSTALLVA